VTTIESESGLDLERRALCALRGNTQATEFPVRLGNHPLAHGQRHETVCLEIASQQEQNRFRDRVEVARRNAIDPGRSCPSIPPHPRPRHRKEGGVADEVEQVTELTLGAVSRPLVQFDLDSQYPDLRLIKRGPRCVGIHRRPPGVSIPLLRSCWIPSPCSRLSRPRTTTDPPPRFGVISRRWTCPPSCGKHEGKGDAETVPTFTAFRLTGSVSSSSAAASPRLRRRLSSWPRSRHQDPTFELCPLVAQGQYAPRPSPYLPDWSWFHSFPPALLTRLLTLKPADCESSLV
jgi:hypothetical protein